MNYIKKNSISCIIATHNREDLLEKTIKSILGQTFNPDEIIVVDNCNSKKTKLVVEKYSSDNFNLKYVSHNYGGRGSSSRNIGALHANCKYLAMIDDDDIWRENYIEEVVKFLNKNEDTKILYTWFDYLIENERIIDGKKLQANLNYHDFLIKNPGAIVSNLVIEKQLFFILGGFNELIHPSYDRDILIKAIKRGFTYNVLKKNLVLMRNQNQLRDSLINYNNIKGQLRFLRLHVGILSINMYIKFFIKLIYQLIFKASRNV